MAVPTITQLPPPPLPTDAEADFDAKAGVSLTAQVTMVVEINASLTWIGQQVTTIDGYRQAAATSATASAASATAAANSATQATTNGAAQVTLAAAEVTKAAAQAQLATTAKNDAQAALASTQSVAAAVQSSAGLPSLVGNAYKVLGVNAAANGVVWVYGLPNTAPGKTGQSVMLAADKSPYWGYAGLQIGDILTTARDPGALFLPANGGIRAQSAYPALFAAIGLMGGVLADTWVDNPTGISTAINAIASNKKGIVIFCSGAIVYRSTNYGGSFTPTTLGSATITDIDTDGAGVWIAVNNTNTAYRSTNDGGSWSPVTIDTIITTGTFSVVKTDGSGVWILGSSTTTSNAMRSTNNGVTYTAIAAAQGQNSLPIRALSVSGNTWIMVVGSTSLAVRRSSNAGASFTTTLTSGTSLNAVASDGAGTWLVSGNASNANTFRSTDDGVNFVALNTPSNLAIRAIDFLQDMFVLVGDSGAVITLSSLGAYTTRTSGTTNGLSDVAVIGGGSVIAVGAGGKAIKSSPAYPYDTATMFALPNQRASNGLISYIKSLEAA